jgi:hypothetical protein
MKFFRLLFSICAALFLFETGGANFVVAQTKPAPAKRSAANLPKVTQIGFEAKRGGEETFARQFLGDLVRAVPRRVPRPSAD